MTLLRCTRCMEEKDPSVFSPLQHGPMGRSYWCRACTAEHMRLRNVDPEVRAAKAAYQRARRQDPEVRRREAIAKAEYQRTHPRKATAEKRAKDRARAATPEGREQARLRAARRRALVAKVDVAFTDEQWVGIVERFQGLCAYCLASGPLEMEHMQPLSRGGAHSEENVVPACSDCNKRKSTKDLLQALAVV